MGKNSEKKKKFHFFSFFQKNFPLLNDPYIYIYIYIYTQAIRLMSSVFTNGLGDQSSIPSRIIPKTQKKVLNAALLNTQHFKVSIKDKVEQIREYSSTLPNTLVW